MRRILSVLLENESGALSRVVGLFSQRGYNIETLNVAPTDDHSLSRLTVTTSGDDLKIEQITKHLNKIVDVVKVVDLTEGAHVERDTLLVKVRAIDAQRDEVKRTAEIFRGQIIDELPVGVVFTVTSLNLHGGAQANLSTAGPLVSFSLRQAGAALQVSALSPSHRQSTCLLPYLLACLLAFWLY